MKINHYFYPQPNYLPWTAIGAVLGQQADRRSFEASTVSILVYFYILCNNKSYKETSGFLRAEPLSSGFEDRKGYREG